MCVCISDWGQSVIRDEMRFYGWWNVSQNTHRKARMRNNFHWYVNISLFAPFPLPLVFQFQFYPLDEHIEREVLPYFSVCVYVFDKYRMWYCCIVNFEDISMEIRYGSILRKEINLLFNIEALCASSKYLDWFWFQRDFRIRSFGV
jgi:hypothetical protein